MKQHHYYFVSTWAIPASLEQCELAVLDIDHWPLWWDGFVAGELTHPKLGIEGSKVEARWRSLFGYHLRLDITIDSYLPNKLISFTSSGDLTGQGSWSFERLNSETTKMVITWDVATTKVWMNVFGPVLKPFLKLAHRYLMRRSQAGLRHYLSS